MVGGELLSFNPAEQVRILDNYDNLAPAIREKLVRTPIRERYIDIFDEKDVDHASVSSESREATRLRPDRNSHAASPPERRSRIKRTDAPTSPLRKRSLVQGAKEERKESHARPKSAKETLPPFLKRAEARAESGKGSKATTTPKEYMINPFNLKAATAAKPGKTKAEKKTALARLPGVRR